MEKLKMEAEKNLQTAIDCLENGEYEKAVKYLELAKEGGNKHAHLLLGDSYNFGRGVEKDLTKAHTLYKELADCEDMDQYSQIAGFNISVMYAKGYGVEKNADKSLEYIIKTADSGFAVAQYTYGYFLENGLNGVEKDLIKAERYYIRAAVQNYMDAILSLIALYANNEKFSKEYMYDLKALYWIYSAMESGNQKAAEYLKIYEDIYEGDLPSEKECYEAVVEDFEWALKLSGKLPKDDEELSESEILLEKGFELMHKDGDNEGAFNAWKKSYELGNINASYYLAQCYDMAIGTKNDAKKGFELYLECAGKIENEEIKMKAEYNVGNGYFNGNGVERDYKKAFEWYSKAADRGHAIAAFNLALCYFNGNHTEIDYNKAFHYASLASENGYVQAMGILGTLYLSGLGTEQDIEKAKYWFKLASDKGDFKAKQILEQILKDEKK